MDKKKRESGANFSCVDLYYFLSQRTSYNIYIFEKQSASFTSAMSMTVQKLIHLPRSRFQPPFLTGNGLDSLKFRRVPPGNMQEPVGNQYNPDAVFASEMPLYREPYFSLTFPRPYTMGTADDLGRNRFGSPQETIRNQAATSKIQYESSSQKHARDKKHVGLHRIPRSSAHCMLSFERESDPFHHSIRNLWIAKLSFSKKHLTWRR